MSLKNFITSIGGARNAAIRFGVNIRSVYQWLDGTHTPREEIKIKIIRASKGRVTYADIVAPYIKRVRTS